MSDSSDSSDGGGNTIIPSNRQIAPCIRWCFTLNNYTKDEVSSILSIFKLKAKKWILGDETGDFNGVPHIQGYVEFKTKVRPKNIVPNNRLHWEKAKGTPLQNHEYCSKQKVLDSFGFPKPIKVIKNLYDWQHKIEDMFLLEPDDRKIYWFWESKGNIGKSQFIKYMIVKHGVLFCSGGKHSDIMNLVFNQDMDLCRGVFFDIPRCNRGAISYASLECVKNGMVCNTKYETGVKVFNSPHIFIFANFEPEEPEKLSDDRWCIIEL
jgi:hypothetical protein